MKQTAVEWLVEQMEINNYISRESIERSYWLVHEAKEMEKKQIEEAWDDGLEQMPFTCPYKNGEHYYNETFKLE